MDLQAKIQNWKVSQASLDWLQLRNGKMKAEIEAELLELETLPEIGGVTIKRQKTRSKFDYKTPGDVPANFQIIRDCTKRTVNWRAVCKMAKTDPIVIKAGVLAVSIKLDK